MRRRTLLAALALAGLVLSSGCLGYVLGPGDVSQEALDRAPAEPYRWGAEVDAHLTVTTNGSFRAVYDLSAAGFDGTLELYRKDSLGSKAPLSIRALRYRYPNGTVIDGSEFEARGGTISKTRKVVKITPPTDGGELAFTAGATPKRFTLPVFLEGSYTLVLPEDRRVDAPIIGNVIPRPDSTETIDGRTHIHWEKVTAQSIVVQYYLQRDIRIFTVLGGLLAVLGVLGLGYYRRQIQLLRERREELGLDVETEGDEFDDGPPPGMG